MLLGSGLGLPSTLISMRLALTGSGILSERTQGFEIILGLLQQMRNFSRLRLSYQIYYIVRFIIEWLSFEKGQLQNYNIKMQINQIKQSPFTRPSLLKNQNLYISSGRHSRVDRKYDNYQSIPGTAHYPLNIWNFRDDHNSNFAPILPNRNVHEISSFQKSMMVNGSTSRKNMNNFQSNNSYKYSSLQNNPFHRKNLLISRQKIEEEVQRDLNMLSYKYMAEHGEKNRNSEFRLSSSPQTTPYESNQNVLNISIMNLLKPIQNEPALIKNQSRHSQKSNSSPQKNPQIQSKSRQSMKNQIRVRGQTFYRATVTKN